MNWCLQTVVLQKTLENPLNIKEIKPVNLKGNQPWIFIGRTDAEASILWPPDTKSQLTGKDTDAGKDWRQKEKGMAEDEIVSITDSMDVSLSKLWEMVKEREDWNAAVHEATKNQTWLSDWITTWPPNFANLYFKSLGQEKLIHTYENNSLVFVLWNSICKTPHLQFDYFNKDE